VSLSLVALGPVSMPINVIRVLRAFRVIRLFGRLKSLKNIVGALTASILPVMNAFLILLIVASICENSPTTHPPQALPPPPRWSRSFPRLPLLLPAPLPLPPSCRPFGPAAGCAGIPSLVLGAGVVSPPFFACPVSAQLSLPRTRTFVFPRLFSRDEKVTSLLPPDSIMGVTFFGDLAPEAFGCFERAFLTVFGITAGDTWVDGVPRTEPDTGVLNYAFAMYIISYIVIANWTVLQVLCAPPRSDLAPSKIHSGPDVW
jgi:hypothetical protein